MPLAATRKKRQEKRREEKRREEKRREDTLLEQNRTEIDCSCVRWVKETDSWATFSIGTRGQILRIYLHLLQSFNYLLEAHAQPLRVAISSMLSVVKTSR